MPTVGLKSGFLIKITQAQYEELFTKPPYDITRLNKLDAVDGRYALGQDAVEFVGPSDPPDDDMPAKRGPKPKTSKVVKAKSKPKAAATKAKKPPVGATKENPDPPPPGPPVKSPAVDNDALDGPDPAKLPKRNPFI